MNEKTPIKMLKNDHQKVAELFSESYKENDPDERMGIVEKIIKGLEIHMELEEQLFYPKLKKNSDEGMELAEHSMQDHQKVKDIISELRSEMGNESALRKLDMAKTEHVKEEEGRVFPFAEKNLQDELSMGLSAKMLALKEKLRMQK